MKKIGLVLDNPKRELYGTMLLAYQLARRGHKAYIIPFYHQSFDAPLLGLNAFVANYVRQANVELLGVLRGMNTLIAVLDTEGGVLSGKGLNSPPNWARHIRESGFGSALDLYFFWGPLVCEAFKKDSGMSNDSLFATGCPRYDLCVDKWQPLLEYDDQGFVLINTNYSGINPKFSGSHGDELKAFVAAGWDEAYARDLIANWSEVWANFLETLEKLFTAMPNERFLLRPHPFESPAPYQERFARFTNVRVDGTGNVFNMIAKSKLTLHLNCGTAIETLLLGKLPVQLEFLNNTMQATHTPLPGKISHRVNSIEELVEVVRAPEKAKAAFNSDAIYREFIHPFFGERDGQAAIRVADHLETALNANSAKPKVSFLQTLFGSTKTLSPKRLAQGALTHLMGSLFAENLRSNLNPRRLEKRLVLKEAQVLLDKIAKLDGFSGNKLQVSRALHPFTGLELETLVIEIGN
jgi:surface carbohydrate biosynthesis protein